MHKKLPALISAVFLTVFAYGQQSSGPANRFSMHLGLEAGATFTADLNAEEGLALISQRMLRVPGYDDIDPGRTTTMNHDGFIIGAGVLQELSEEHPTGFSGQATYYRGFGNKWGSFDRDWLLQFSGQVYPFEEGVPMPAYSSLILGAQFRILRASLVYAGAGLRLNANKAVDARALSPMIKLHFLFIAGKKGGF